MFQYSFANVDLLLEIDTPGSSNDTNFKVEGFSMGEDLISLSRKAPIATTQFGAYGDMVVSMQRVLAGDLVFPLLMNSPENKALQDWCNYFQDQADKDGELIKPIQAQIVDNMGKDEAIMHNGVILAIPALTRGVTMNTVTWVISFEAIKIAREIGGDYSKL